MSRRALRRKYFRSSFAALAGGLGVLVGTLLGCAGVRDGRWVLAGIGCAIVAIGWSLLLSARLEAGRRARLLLEGKAVTGTVTRVEEAPRALAFEYRDDTGARRSGRSARLPRALEERWRPGSSLRVVYDVLDPELCEADIFDALAGPSRP